MSIEPKGEHIRNAVKWVSDKRLYEPDTALNAIVEEASVKFDLSPAEADWLRRFVMEQS